MTDDARCGALMSDCDDCDDHIDASRGNELRDAGKSFLRALFSAAQYRRWSWLRKRVGFSAESAFVKWLLDNSERSVFGTVTPNVPGHDHHRHHHPCQRRLCQSREQASPAIDGDMRRNNNSNTNIGDDHDVIKYTQQPNNNNDGDENCVPSKALQVYNPNWPMSVRIGDEGVSGLNVEKKVGEGEKKIKVSGKKRWKGKCSLKEMKKRVLGDEDDDIIYSSVDMMDESPENLCRAKGKLLSIKTDPLLCGNDNIPMQSAPSPSPSLMSTSSSTLASLETFLTNTNMLIDLADDDDGDDDDVDDDASTVDVKAKIKNLKNEYVEKKQSPIVPESDGVVQMASLMTPTSQKEFDKGAIDVVSYDDDDDVQILNYISYDPSHGTFIPVMAAPSTSGSDDMSVAAEVLMSLSDRAISRIQTTLPSVEPLNFSTSSRLSTFSTTLPTSPTTTSTSPVISPTLPTSSPNTLVSTSPTTVPTSTLPASTSPDVPTFYTVSTLPTDVSSLYTVSTLPTTSQPGSGNKYYQCKSCSHRANKQSSIERHVYTHVHKKMRPYKCDKCGYSCCQKVHLREHMLKHAGEKPFKCRVCGHSSSRKSDLIKHIKMKHHKLTEKEK